MLYQPSFREIIQAFFRRKTLFTLTVALVCLMGGGYLVVTTPLYMSTASLVLHFDTKSVPDIDRTVNQTQLQGSNEHREVLNSDADILQSPDLIRSVIKTIGLPRLYPRIAASDLTDGAKEDIAHDLFASNLSVEVGQQSNLLGVSYLHPSPTVAREAVQELLDQFYGKEALVYANPQLKFAETEAAAARDKLLEAQKQLTDFKAQHQIADMTQQIQQFLQSRTDVESRLRIAQGRVLEAEQRRDALKQLLDTVPPTTSSSATGEQYQSANAAAAQLDQLKAKRSQMASTYRPDSAVFQQLDAQISSLSAAVGIRNGEARARASISPNKVYESIKTDLLRASAEATSARQPEQVLTQQLAQINGHLADLEKVRSQYDNLSRTVDIQNDTYKSLAIRYETARVEANRNAQKISAAVVIAAPMVANEPARPRRKVVALATVMAALLAGIASVLAMEGFDDRFRTPTDVTRILRLPVLATFDREA